MRIRKPTVVDDVNADRDELHRLALRAKDISKEVRDCKTLEEVEELKSELSRNKARAEILTARIRKFYAPATMGA